MFFVIAILFTTSSTKLNDLFDIFCFSLIFVYSKQNHKCFSPWTRLKIESISSSLKHCSFVRFIFEIDLNSLEFRNFYNGVSKPRDLIQIRRIVCDSKFIDHWTIAWFYCSAKARSPADIKDMLLRWSRAKTRGYEVSNHCSEIIKLFSLLSPMFLKFFQRKSFARMYKLKISLVAGPMEWHFVHSFIIFSLIHLISVNWIRKIGKKIWRLLSIRYSQWDYHWN